MLLYPMLLAFLKKNTAIVYNWDAQPERVDGSSRLILCFSNHVGVYDPQVITIHGWYVYHWHGWFISYIVLPT